MTTNRPAGLNVAGSHSMTLTRRKSIALAMLVVFGAWLFGYNCVSSPGSGITRENFERIKIGMPLAEVNHILNCKPGDYTFGRTEFRPALTGELVVCGDGDSPDARSSGDPIAECPVLFYVTPLMTKGMGVKANQAKYELTRSRGCHRRVTPT